MKNVWRLAVLGASALILFLCTAGGGATPPARAAPPPQDCPTAFADVPAGSPDLPAALCAVCNGFMLDIPCGGPGQPCNPNNDPYFDPWVARSWLRRDLAKLIVQAAGWSIDTSSPPYSDVPPSDPYYTWIQTARTHGVLIDYDDGTFRPYNAMDRGRFARALVLGTDWAIDTSGGPHFADVPPTHPFYAYIETVWHHQAMLGYADGTFHPDSDLASPRIDLAMILSVTFHPACGAVPRPETPPAGATETPTPPPPIPTAMASATPACAGLPCSDVHPDDYFYTAWRDLICRQGGIITGYGDGTCRPYNETTRSQLVKIVMLAFERPIVTPTPAGGQTFADVPPTHPFFAVIETAAAAGVGGYPCGGPAEPCDAQHRPYFRPYALVTRGQVAKIVAVAAGWSLLTPATARFADVPPGAPNYSYIETAACWGILSGYACGGPNEPCDAQGRPYFRPGATARRGQIVKIVDAALYTGQTCLAAPAAP